MKRLPRQKLREAHIIERLPCAKGAGSGVSRRRRDCCRAGRYRTLVTTPPPRRSTRSQVSPCRKRHGSNGSRLLLSPKGRRAFWGPLARHLPLHRGGVHNVRLRRNTTLKGSLVQRELSAKLTEGLFYRLIYVFANAVKVLAYLMIWYPYDRQAISSQKARSIRIFRHGIRLKML